MGSSGQIPGTPTNVQVAIGQTFRATWARPLTGPSPTGYRLDIGSGSNFIASFSVGRTPAFEIAIPPGVSGAFTLTVTALNLSVAGPPSPPVPFTLGSCSTLPPPAVSGSVVNGVANVHWPAVAGATGYAVAAGTSPGAIDLLPQTNVGGQTSVSQSGLPNGFTAWVRVYAMSGCASSYTDHLLR